MGKAKALKTYAVARGRIPGIYSSWAETEAQVKGYPAAVHKSFGTRVQAEVYMASHGHGLRQQQPRQPSPLAPLPHPPPQDQAQAFPPPIAPPISRPAVQVEPQPKASSSRSVGRFYAVARGRHTGVYGSWSETETQVKGFGGAMYKSFETRGQAEAYLAQHGRPVTPHPSPPQSPQGADPPQVAAAPNPLPSNVASSSSWTPADITVKGDFYAVSIGHNPGIYTNWSDCKEQLVDHPFPTFKKFSKMEDAIEFMRPAMSLPQEEQQQQHQQPFPLPPPAIASQPPPPLQQQRPPPPPPQHQSSSRNLDLSFRIPTGPSRRREAAENQPYDPSVGFMIQIGVEGYEKYQVPPHARYNRDLDGPFPPP